MMIEQHPQERIAQADVCRVITVMAAGIVFHIQVFFRGQFSQPRIRRRQVLGRVDIEQLDRVRMRDLGKETRAHELFHQRIVAAVDIIGGEAVP